MTNNCSVCGKFVSTQTIKCIVCASCCHRQCAINAKTNTKAPARWLCKRCNTNQISPEKSSTPKDLNKSSTVSSDCSKSSPDESDKTLLHDIKLELIKVAQEMSLFRNELSHLTTTLTSLNKRFDEVDIRISALENNTEQRISSLETRLSKLELDRCIATNHIDVKSELNEMNQRSLRNDLEISGIDESKNENLFHITTALAQSLGVAMDERDIVFAERKGQRSGVSETGKPTRPRPVIIRLARQMVRDDLLRSARKLPAKFAGSNDVTNLNVTKFYINERLTAYNRNLFYHARQEGKRKGWRFVWTHKGHIFARQNPDSVKNIIIKDSDIEVVFKNTVE